MLLPPAVTLTHAPEHQRILPLRSRHDGGKRIWLVAGDPNCTTLAETIAKDGPFKLRDALSLFYQIADIIVFLHDHGILHGSIYPSTVFCRDRKQCFVGVADEQFSAEERELLNHEGRAWRDFIAPEVLAGAQPDSRSDVYSLGVLLHWLLTGKSPHGSVSRKIPQPVAHIIERAIEHDAELRSQTVEWLTDGLQRIVYDDLRRYENELELAVSAAGFDPRLLWARHPRLVIVSVCLTAMVIAGGYWGYSRYEEQQQQQMAAQDQKLKAQAAVNSYRRRYDSATANFEKGNYRDAIESYKLLIEEKRIPALAEQAMIRLARSHGALKDYGNEHTAWLKLVHEHPDTSAAGEATERMIWINKEALMRYGDLQPIRTRLEIVVDGLPDDWGDIEPVLVDEVGDNAKGGAASDLVRFYAAVCDDTLYLRFDTAAPSHEGDQYCVAVDLNAYAYDDSVEEWDYQIGVAKGIAPWIWDLRGSRNYSNAESVPLTGVKWAQAKCVEVSLPLAALGRPTSAAIRPFLNYAGMKAPNDVIRRKVLLEWSGRQAKEPEAVDAAPKAGQSQ